MRLFKRRLRAVIGRPGEDGVDTTGLRLSVRVERHAGSETDTATVQVYNLSGSRRGSVEGGSGQVVQVWAGYGDTDSRVFVGDVGSVRTVRQRPDIVTEIAADDGGARLVAGRISETWRGSTSALAVARRAVAALGLPLGYVDPQLADVTLVSGYTAMGLARDVLDEVVVGTLGGAWLVQDGAVIITTSDGASTRVAPVLAAASGLIGTPERTDDGWKIVALYRPLIVPRALVRVESPTVSAWMRIGDTTTSLDSGHDAAFYVEAEAVEA